MRAILSVPFHPVLFGLMRVVHVLSENVDHLPFRDAVRSLVVAPIGTLLVWGIMFALIRRAHKAALLTTVAVGWFLVSGDLFENVMIGILVTSIVFVSAVVFVLRSASSLEPLTRFLNVTALLVTGFALANVAQAMMLDDYVDFDQVDGAGQELVSVPTNPERRPDVYYIVLDGYGRNDVLKDLYDFDNRPFLDALAQLGFIVAEDAKANYAQTMLSLGSSLNLSHMPEFVEANGETETHDRSLLIRALRRSRLVRFFRRLDYSTVTISSGIQATEFHDFDIRYAPRFSMNEFEYALLHNTILMRFLDSQQADGGSGGIFYALHRQRIRFTLDTLREIPALDGPKFVLVHLLSPHPPFVFRRDGSPLNPGTTGSLMERTKDAPAQAKYVEGYSEQIRFLTDEILACVQAIVERDPGAIIVLQSDHGPAAQINWENPKETNMRERFGILSAYYVPEPNRDAFYQTMTPVNSFRAVLNTVFGASLPMLPDISYFSSIDRPFAFQEVEVE